MLALPRPGSNALPPRGRPRGEILAPREAPVNGPPVQTVNEPSFQLVNDLHSGSSRCVRSFPQRACVCSTPPRLTRPEISVPPRSSRRTTWPSSPFSLRAPTLSARMHTHGGGQLGCITLMDCARSCRRVIRLEYHALLGRTACSAKHSLGIARRFSESSFRPDQSAAAPSAYDDSATPLASTCAHPRTKTISFSGSPSEASSVGRSKSQELLETPHTSQLLSDQDRITSRISAGSLRPPLTLFVNVNPPRSCAAKEHIASNVLDWPGPR